MKIHPAHFIVQYNRLGVRFIAHGPQVQPAGRGVSPAFAIWTAEHSADLLPWLGTQAQIVSRETLPAPVAQPTHGDRLIHAGIQNARRAAQRKAAIIENRTRRTPQERR